ncbi:MAG TPA: TIGR03620 family F420-dependent LLM class oxidoreductase [Thermoanaerobaculia bacterium]|nr:TIGR03620 family F420-dependent LLM class oxidoreductase [Thermoanaerobaculia bacterium]
MTQPLETPGRLGVWTWSDGFSPVEAVDFAHRLEGWGYSTLWTPEAVGRDPFSFIGYLAGRTERLILATGIANIYARDAMTTKAIRKTLSGMLPARFILGLGVSHPHLVSKVRGHEWRPPLEKMREYLDAVESALYMGPEPEVEAPIVIAALRPKMLALAAEKARGAHPYLVTPEHTRRAREILGGDRWLCTEQKLILTTDAEKARELARGHLKQYLRAPNYQNSLREIGFEDSDWAKGTASDRLVDALVAWGDEGALRERIQEHWDAGADQVCVQPFRADGKPGPCLDTLEKLANLNA